MKHALVRLVGLLTAALIAHVTYAGDYERLLYDKLTSGYNPLARPIKNDSEPVIVHLGVDFQQLLDIEEKSQVMVSNVWLKMRWVDIYLTWDPNEFGGIKEVRMPIKYIWRPDVLLYNSVDQQFDSLWPINAVVYSTGDVTWIPPAIIKSSCRIDIRWFPFDEQQCEMKFGSWTYSGQFIDLLNDTVSLDTYKPNGEWHLLGLNTKRNIYYYECCPDPYYDVTFTIWVRRRTLYYGLNLVIPCILISSLTLLEFTLPPDSGEKLTLGITIFMSLCVFLLMVAEAMPQTSDTIPLIATYFSCIMIDVSASVVFTVLVLNYHHRSTETYSPMSPMMRSILLEWLPWILMMKRPGYKLKKWASKLKTRRTNSFTDMELKERCSKSLLANVLDIDEESLSRFDASLESTLRNNQHQQTNNSTVSTPDAVTTATSIGSVPNSPRSAMKSAVVQRAAVVYQMPPARANSEQLNQIIRELRLITDRMRREDGNAEGRADWKFAAMVIDRICLIAFTSFLLVSTCAILFSAPQLIA
uniref:Uncharacterized protein n=1 Tax=Plectus sambesii TaxID=2011161 RepID=A0A914V026_9BILA